MSAVAVFITAANAREARRLAETLVAEKLAACVTDAGVVRSVYRCCLLYTSPSPRD